VLSLVFVKNLEEMKKVISEVWNKLCKKISFAKSWIEKFLKGFQVLLRQYSNFRKIIEVVFTRQLTKMTIIFRKI